MRTKSERISAIAKQLERMRELNTHASDDVIESLVTDFSARHEIPMEELRPFVIRIICEILDKDRADEVIAGALEKMSSDIERLNRDSDTQA